MDETRIENILQVFAKENGLLTAPYSEDKVKKTRFQMEHNKAPVGWLSCRILSKFLGSY
jgi:hypothetical protein